MWSFLGHFVTELHFYPLLKKEEEEEEEEKKKAM